MKAWLSNSSAEARFSESKVRAFVRNALKLKRANKLVPFTAKFKNENNNSLSNQVQESRTFAKLCSNF